MLACFASSTRRERKRTSVNAFFSASLSLFLLYFPIGFLLLLLFCLNSYLPFFLPSSRASFPIQRVMVLPRRTAVNRPLSSSNPNSNNVSWRSPTGTNHQHITNEIEHERRRKREGWRRIRKSWRSSCSCSRMSSHIWCIPLCSKYGYIHHYHMKRKTRRGEKWANSVSKMTKCLFLSFSAIKALLDHNRLVQRWKMNIRCGVYAVGGSLLCMFMCVCVLRRLHPVCIDKTYVPLDGGWCL